MKKPFFIISVLVVSFALFSTVIDSRIVVSDDQLEISDELSGLWKDSNSSVHNAYAIFSAEGSQLEMMHYLEYEGKPLVEKGKGRIFGRRLDYFVVVTKPIPGWAITGEHFLTLSEDGKTLRGAYEDERGNVGPLVFKKVGK